MSRRIGIRAIALFLFASSLLISCQAVANAPKAMPGLAVKSSLGACTPGAQDEMIQTYGGFKMTGATSGWALGQCSLGARPTFQGGSTIKCLWPGVESSGILRTSDGGHTWTDVSPPSVPNRTWHHAQFFLDAMHAWVVEGSRTASECVNQVSTYRTSDGGKTWQRGATVPVRTAKPTDDIFNVGGSQEWMGFSDPQHGWLLVIGPSFGGTPDSMATPSTLYNTGDGGLHWKLVTNDPGRKELSSASCRPNYYYLGGIKFTSVTDGWLTANCPGLTILKTRDGGATWRPQQLPDCSCQVWQPIFVDSTHGFITGQQSAVMLATTDGGTSWAQRQVPAGALKYFSFTDPSNGWVVAVEQLVKNYDTALYRTTDGGRSWSLIGRPGFATPTSTKNAYYSVFAMQFVDANVGFVGLGPLTEPRATPDPFGTHVQLLATEDGGRNWKTVLKQVPPRPCISQYAEIVGPGGSGSLSLSPMKYATATKAWAKGGLRTTDAGAHWRDVSPASLREGASTPLYPPGYTDFFLDGDRAWQAGVYGSATSCSDHITTFATSDGGKTWQQSTPIALDLPSGYGRGQIQMGFPTQQSGWLFIPIGVSKDSDSWFGPPATFGYLFGTSDGGVNWRRVATIDVSVYKGPATNTNCQLQLGQVTFSSATDGWMTLNCMHSKILVTRDGGVTWKMQALSVPCDCQVSVPTFVDQTHGFMQIYGGGRPGGNTIMSTSDAGATWKTLPPVPGAGFTMGLNFADANNLWALIPPPGWNKGSGGKMSLYRSTDGGQSWAVVQDAVPIGRAYSLQFADDKHGMVVQPRNAYMALGSGGFLDAQDIELVVTSDGGHTWKEFKPAVG